MYVFQGNLSNCNILPPIGYSCCDCVCCCLFVFVYCCSCCYYFKVVPRSIRRLLDKNLTFHKAIAWMLIVSSAVHVMAHYYNYERLSRYAPPDNLPPGEQANPPLGAIPPALQANIVRYRSLIDYMSLCVTE